MKQKTLALLFALFLCTQIFAQDFYGYVKKADSTASPIYQANVEITENYKPFKTLKTYFDGSFKFTPAKDQIYTIKISYNGYLDTAYTITTEKNGKLSAQKVTVKLKKDGMRLMGVIKGADEDFPIKGATIILKNVMTREENRITTDIDGKYNFKLAYETNYRVSIDKRSTGIFNKYQDTAFYISTVGFNQPLDYKLDIKLDPMLYPTTTARDGYDATKPVQAKIKPVIEVVPNATAQKQALVAAEEKTKTSQDLNAKTTAGIENTQDDSLQRIKTEQEKDLAAKKLFQDSIQQAAASLQAKAIEDSVVKVNAQIALKKAYRDSVNNAAAAARAKFVEDSVTLLKTKQEKLAAKKLYQDSVNKVAASNRAQFVEDSIQKVKAQYAAWKAHRDSVRQAALAARAKFVEDSVAMVKAKQQKLAAKRLYQDSVNKVAASNRAKFVEDSILKVKAQYAAWKAHRDSVRQAALAARAKFVEDSVALVKAKQEKFAAKKLYQDSVNRVAASNRAKFVEDSVAQSKSKWERLVAKKLYEDSVKRVNALAGSREKIVLDSVNRIKAAELKRSKDLALKKIKEDSVEILLLAVRNKIIADNVVIGHTAARKKLTQDSLLLLQAQKELLIKGIASHKAHEDWLDMKPLEHLLQAVRDSIIARKATSVKEHIALDELLLIARAGLEKAENELAERLKNEDARAAERKKAINDLIRTKERLIAEVERLKKETQTE